VRAPITASTPVLTNVGVFILVGAAIWTAADRWFGYQNNVAAQMATMNERLAKLETLVSTVVRRPTSD